MFEASPRLTLPRPIAPKMIAKMLNQPVKGKGTTPMIPKTNPEVAKPFLISP
jgi:hypothetical protein